MKMKLLFAAACACLLFCLYSCQKENEIVTPDPEKLVKTVEKAGADSVVTAYQYDPADRLSLVTISGTLSGVDRTGQFLIQRNGAGVVTQTVEKSAQLLLAGCDSVLTRFVYSAASGRYTYNIITAEYPGSFVYDSIIYDFDVQGRITRENHYQTVTPGPAANRYNVDFTYTSAGDIDSVNYSDFDPATGNFTLTNYVVYSYDQKVNPLQLGNEAVLFYLFPFRGSHNSTGSKAVFINAPAFDFNSTAVHVYDAENRPQTTVTTKSNGSITNTTWYYQ